MSEVKRYGHIGYLVNASDKLIELYPDMTVYVKAADFDRVTAELADRKAKHLRSCQIAIGKSQLAKQRHAEVNALQARLTAADERADVQTLALREVVAACDLAMSAIDDDDERGANFVKIIAAIKAKAALKQAEGGGDDYRKSCEVAHKALSMENQRITPVEKKTDPRVIDALREAGYLRND